MKDRLQYLVRVVLFVAFSLISNKLAAQFDDITYGVTFGASPSSVVCDAPFNIVFNVNDPAHTWKAEIQTSLGTTFTMNEGNKGQASINTSVTYTIVKITDSANPATVLTMSKVYSVTVTHTSSIAAKTVISNGTCATGPITISVLNSDAAVSYQLQTLAPAAGVVQTLTGNGGTLNFSGVTAPGRYVVVGSSPGCSAQMNGEINISEQINTAFVVNGGQGCLPGALSLTTTGSQINWEYELIRDGVPTGIKQKGTGSPLLFNITTAGVYTVSATSAGCGTSLLSGSYTAHPQIAKLTVTGSSACFPASTTVGLGSSEVGVKYYLKLNGAIQPPVAGINGTGGALNFGAVSAQGVYTVSASRGTCTEDMNGSVTITPGIDKSITVLAPLTGCVGGSNTISLSGSQAGVVYSLYKVGTPTAIQTKNGTGSGKVTFTGISDEGDYYVVASMAACGATETLTGTYTIEGLSGVVAVREYCANNAFTVTVIPVQAGVTYTLKRGTTVIASNSTGSFNVSAADAIAGTYTVSGKQGTCSEQVLPGVITVVSPIVMQTMTGPATVPLCSDQQYSFGISGTQAGVVYQLVNQLGVVMESITSTVTGGAMNFSTRNYVPGVYTVKASYSAGTCAPVTMNGSFTVVKAPNLYKLVNVGPVCSDKGLVIELNGSDAASYTLYNNGVAVTTNTTGKFGLIKVPGVYTVEAVLNGCSVAMDGVAVIDQMPDELTFSASGIACPSANLVLTGASQPRVGYELWRNGVYVGPRLTVSTAGASVNFGTLMTPGTYTVRAVNLVNGCWIDFTDQLIIEKSPTKPVLNANTLTYCGLPSGVHLSVKPESADYWYQLYKGGAPVSGQVYGDAGLNMITWQNVTAGNYYVVAGNRGGCTIQSDRIIVTSGGLQAYISAMAPTAGCIGTEFTIRVDLSGTPPFNFTIVDDKGNTVRTVTGYNPVPPTNPISYTTKVTPSSTTSYFVRNITDVSGCVIPDGDGSADVTVHPTPDVSITPANPQICVGQGNVELVASTTNVAGCTYVWSATTGGAAMTGDRITVSPSVTTQYEVVATSPNGCVGRSQVTVTVNPLPVVDFTIPPSVCANATPVTLIGTPVGGTFTVNGVPIAQFNPANYAPDQSYVIRYEVNSGGCIVFVEKPIFIHPLPEVEILNLQPVYCADAGIFTIIGRPDRIDNIPGRLDGYFTVNGDRFNPADPHRFWNEHIVNGDVTASFDIAQILGIFEAPKNLTITYYYTDINGCQNSETRVTQIRPDYNNDLSFSGLPVNPCQDDLTEYPLIPLLNGKPVNRATLRTLTFSGPGIVDKGGGNYVFVPFEAGNGVHTITLSVEDIYGCTGGVSQQVTIGVELLLGMQSVYCKTDAGIPVFPTPHGGVLKIEGPITRDAGGNIINRGHFVQYDPIAGPAFPYTTWEPTNNASGEYLFTYEYLAAIKCFNTRTWSVTIVDTPNPDFSIGGRADNDQTYCLETGFLTLTPTMRGGNFSRIDEHGNVTSLGSVLDTRVMGYGIHTIRYRIGSATCFDIQDKIVRIQPPTPVDFNLEAQYCSRVLDKDGNVVDNIVEIKAINPDGNDLDIGVHGYFTSEILPVTPPPGNTDPNYKNFLKDNGNNTAIIYPYKVDGPFVKNIRVWFTYTDKNGCVNTIEKTTTVYNVVNVSFATENGKYAFCKNEPPVKLIGSFASTDIHKLSGVFSSDLLSPAELSNNMKMFHTGAMVPDGTAILDPSKMDPGLHPIKYTYTSEQGCLAYFIKEIEIYDIPIKYQVIGEKYYCKDDPGSRIGLAYAQAGVTYQLMYEGNLPPVLEYKPTVDGPFYFKAKDAMGNYTTADARLKAGTYTVRGKTDKSCYEMMLNPFTVIENSVDVTIVKTDIQCKGANNGVITITASGGLAPYGYTYSTDGGATYLTPQSGNEFINLAPGNYHIKAIDQIGCESQPVLVTITEPALDIAVNTVPGSLRKVGCTPCTLGGSCEGAIEINIVGGTPFSNNVVYPSGYQIEWFQPLDPTGYQLLPAFNNRVSASHLSAGDYYARITDSRGCTYVHMFTIQRETPLNIVKNPDPATHINNVCYGGQTGSFEIIVTGGSVPGDYIFMLNDQYIVPTRLSANPADPLFSHYRYENLKAGSYKVDVFDKNYPRCSVVLSPDVVIHQPVQISAVVSNMKPQSCQNVDDGQFELLTTGGVAPYQYSKDGVNWQASQLFTGLKPATYTIYIRDANGCIRILDPIVVPTANDMTALVSLVTPVKCFGESTGAVKVEVKGGSTPYSYQWYRNGGALLAGQLANSANGLPADDYYVVVTDASGCSITSTLVNVPQPATKLAFGVVIDQGFVGCDCNPALNQCEGAARVIVANTGGTAGYSVVWSTGATTTSVTNLQAGDYHVTVTNDNGCSVTDVFRIQQNADLNLNELSRKAVSCSGRIDGEVEVVAAGGSGVYEFRIISGANLGNWETGDVDAFGKPTTHKTFKNLAASMYSIEVRDANYTRCTLLMPNVEITSPAPIDGTRTTQDASCYSSADGVINIHATGGWSVYQYSIDNGATFQTSNQFTNLAGSLVGQPYYVVVADAADKTCLKVVGPTYIYKPNELDISDIVITPESCNNQGDATITVNVKGGWGTINNPKGNVTVPNYSIDNGNNWQTLNTFSGLMAGTYTIKVRDANARVSCEVTRTVTILPETAISADLVSKKNVQCFGTATGEFSVRSLPVGSTLEYRVTKGANVVQDWTTKTTFKGLTAGTYDVSVRRGTCYGHNVLQVQIDEPAASVSIDKIDFANVTCPKGSDGHIRLSVSGGTAPYSYLWIKLPTNNSVPKHGADADFERSGLTAGQYKFTVMDANGCSATDVVNITQPADWHVDYVVTPVSILGASNGKIDITSVSGGTPPYAITWADGVAYNGRFTRPDLGVGVYTYTITDVKGCSITGDIPVPDHRALNVNVDWSDIKCNGSLAGEISVLILNGQPDFTIEWTGPVSGIVNNYPGDKLYRITNLPAGTYAVKITDSNGAVIDRVITIRQPFYPLDVNAGALNKQCSVDNKGSIIANASGGTPFVDAGGNKYYIIDVLPGFAGLTTNPVTLNNIPAGSYQVRVTDANSCFVIRDVVVDTYPALSFGPIITTDVTCNGEANGTIEVTAVNGAVTPVYHWEMLDGAGNWQPMPSIVGNRAEMLAAGTYRVTALQVYPDNSCSITSNNIIVKVPAPLQVNHSKVDVVSCNGDKTGKILVKAIGGTAPYQISLNGAPAVISVDGNYTFSNLAAGSYLINVIDSKMCSYPNNPVSVIITEPQPLQMSLFNSYIDCDNNNSGVVKFELTGGVVKSGLSRYEVSVNGPVNKFIYVDNNYSSMTGRVPVNINMLPEGDYVVTVKDLFSNTPNQCPVTQNFTLALLKLNAVVDEPVCESNQNGSISVSVTGNSGVLSYTWRKRDAAGNYQPYATTQNLVNLPAGEYQVSVTDPLRGCTVVKSFILNYKHVLSVNGAIQHERCFGGNDGAITKVVVSGVVNPVYSWTGPGGFSANTAEITGLVPGTYVLTVADPSISCTVVQSFEVKPATQLMYSLSRHQVSCAPYVYRINVDGITGGVAPYKYSWSGPGSITVDASGNAVNLTKGGTYVATISDQNGCIVTKSITIPLEIELSATVDQLSCALGNNGFIDLTVKGGSGSFSYQWTKDINPAIIATTQDIDNLTSGVYKVVVTDLVEGCVKTALYEIFEPTAITITGALTHVTCFGSGDGKIVVTPAGGQPPYTYQWSNGATTKDIGGLLKGNYTVVVTDAKGCTSNKTFRIYEPDAIDFDLVIKTPVSCDGTGARISIENLRGGWLTENGVVVTNPATGAVVHSPVYDIVWAGPAIVNGNRGQTDLSNLTSGTYVVTITDASAGRNSCKFTKSIYVPTPVKVGFSTTTETCEGINDGSITLNVTGGLPPYSYVWTTTDGFGLNVNAKDQIGLSSGHYTVVVSDSRTPACTVTQDIYVDRAYVLDVNGSTTDVACFGEQSGMILLNVSGGSGNYTYHWTGTGTGIVAADKNQTHLSVGSYSVTVTDNVLGCTPTKSFYINAPLAPLVIDKINVTNILCKGSATGIIDIVVKGGTPFNSGDYKYNWNGPGVFTDSHRQENLIAGTYNVVVTDRNGCIVTSSNIIVQEPALALSAVVDFVGDVSAFRGNDGEIQILVGGGSGAYSIVWSGVPERADTPLGLLINNATRQTNLVAGTYRAVITDLNGCSVVLDNIIVRQPGSELDLVIAKKDVRPCYNDASGQIDVSVVGGKLPYIIRMYNSAGVQIGGDRNGSSTIFAGLVPGVYTVTAADANRVFVSRDVIITQPAALTITANVVDHVACYQASTGIFNLAVNGGMPTTAGNNYRVIVSGPGGFTDTRSNYVPGVAQQYVGLSAGVYNILVIDDSNGDGKFDVNTDCSASSTVTITEPTAHVDLSVSDDICAGNSSQLKFIVSNWSVKANPLTVTLSDGSVIVVNDSPFLHSVTPATTTTYQITSVTDGAGCSKGSFDGKGTVIVRPRPTARVSGSVDVCLGDAASVSVDLTGTAPWSIDIFNGTSTVPVTNITKSPYIHTFTPSANQSVTVTSVRDAFCSNTGEGSVAVTVNSLPNVTINGETTICFGSKTNILFGFTGGKAPYRLSYSANGIMYHIPNIIPDASGNYTMEVQPGITTTYEVVRVEDVNGCMRDVTGTIVVSVRPMPGVPGAITGKPLVCQGEKGVVYSIMPVANATNYEWNLPIGAVIVSGLGSTSITVDFADDYAGGVFGVVAVNSCGKSNSSDKLISASELPGAAGVITGPVNLCQGATGVQYSIVPVQDASSYDWTLPVGFNIVAGAGTANIIVDLNPAVDVLNGIIRVLPKNSCGDGIVSPDLAVTVTPLPVSFAGHDQNLCANSYVLQADAPRAGEQGHWTIVKGSGVISAADINNHNATVTNLSQGENILQWRVENTTTKCFTTDEVRLFNNILSVVAIVEQRIVCDGTAKVEGTRVPLNSTGLWTFEVGGGVIVSPTVNQSDIVNLLPGRSVLRWTIEQNGCKSYAEVEIINDKPDDAKIVGDVISLCDDKVTLTGNVPVEGTGYWTRIKGLGVIDNPASNVINVTNLSQGENIFRYTITKGGCKTYDEVVVHNNMLDVDAGDDKVTCDDFIKMNAKPAPAGTSAHWEIAYGEGSGVFEKGDDPATMITHLGPGSNKFYWIVNKNGCISKDEVIIVSNKPTTATTGSQQVVCDDYATLTGNDKNLAGKGFWSVVSGSGVFDDPLKGVTTVRNLQQGKSVFRWNIVNNGCVSYSDQIVENLKVETNAGKDTSVCSNTTTLHGNPVKPGQIGEWTLVAGMGGATIVASNDPLSRVGGLANGPNGFVWTITQKSCVSRDTVIIYNNRPYPVAAGPDQVVSGTNTTMAATVPVAGTGRWSLVAGGGTIVDPTNPFSQVTNLRRGDNIFRWTVSNGFCSEYDDIVITNGQTIDANAGENKTVCENFYTLHANDPDIGIGEWSVISGSGDFDDPYNPRTRVTRLGKGVNVFRWSIYYTNSVSYSDVTITNNAPDKAKGGPRERIVCGDSHKMEGNIPLVGSPKWTIISGGGSFVDDTNPNTVVNNLAKGWSKFKYEISYKGCSSTDTVRVLNDMPDIADAGNDDVVCNGQYELKPNTPTFGTGEWVVVEGKAKFSGNYATELAQGRNVFAWIIRGSTPTCFTRDEVVVINNEPSQAFAGRDQDVCDNQTRLGATAPLNGVGRWTLIHGAGIIADEFDRSTKVTGLALGSNRFRWTVDNNGCTSSHEVEVRNNYIQAVAGNDPHITLCVDTLVLGANNPSPGVGTWGVKGGSGKATFVNPKDPNTVVRGLDKGDNVLTWTIMHKNCPSVAEIIITNNSPSVANAGGNQSLCDKDFTTLNASKPAVGVGKWTIKSGGATIANDKSNSTQITNIAFGDNIFNWRVENKGCYSEDDVQVSYNRIEAKAGSSDVICSESTQLDANNPNPGIGTWSVVGGTSQAQFADIHDPNSVVNGLAKGKNTLRWTIDYRNCVTYDEIVIQNDLPSRAYAGNSLPICSDEIVLDATPVQIGVGKWTVLTGSGLIADDLDPKTKVTKLSKGDNVFRWTVVNNNCRLTDDVRITNNLPSEPYAGKSEEICSNSFTLKANPAEYGTGIWSIVQGSGNFSNPLSPNSMITNLAEGENILRWTLTQGQCAVYSEVILTNNSSVQAKAGPDIDDCKDYAVLDGNIPSRGVGKWSLVSGKAVFDDSSNPKTMVRQLGFGENILQWTITNGKCFSSDRVVISNRIPDQADAGTNRTICDDYLTLNANNPTSGVGSWSVVSGKGVFDDPLYNRTIVRGVGYGENVYRWTVTYGSCTTIDEVVVISQKAEPYAGEDDVVYVNSYELKAGNPGSIKGKWKIVAGSGRFADDTYYNTMVYDLHPGVNTFRWTINTEGCEAFDDVVIEYRQVPQAGFAVDVSEGCAPLKVRFTDQSVGAKEFAWDFNDGDKTTIRNPIHTFVNPGNYNVVLTTAGPDGKDTQYSKLIKVYDHPKADFDAAPTLVFLPDDVVRFRNFSIDGVKWSWTFGDGGVSEEKNPQYKYVADGLYTVSLTVWNQHGCEDKIIKPDFIEARKGGFITFPNTFRPRPDGGGGDSQFDLNAIFKPVYQDVDQFHLQIFNRWGQLIYETSDIDKGWNGFFSGQIAPQGVYVWVATGRFISGKEFSKTGHVLLAR